ncbi:MAG: hypothetical protein SOZ40_06040 [Ezakiella sp.]|nr:hypothetical protein [Ezakiella sp.]
MGRATRVYDPEKVYIQIDGIYITGFSENSKLTIEKSEDNLLPKVGVEGTVSYAVNHNVTAKAKISLMSTSASIPLIRELGESRKFFNLTIVDMNTNGKNVSCDDCVVIKTPNIERNKEVEEEEFEIFIPYYEDVVDVNGR